MRWDGRSNLVAGPSDTQHGEDDDLENRPSDKGREGREVERGPTGLERIRPQDPFERVDERSAQVKEAGHDRVPRTSINRQQEDPQPDDQLDDPEQDDHDP